MSYAAIRPDLAYAWRGPALLIVNNRGECDPAHALAGFYYRETRYLSTLRLEINGARPWLCELGAVSPSELQLVFNHPELSHFGGGGSGQAGDEVERDEHGVPFRALDLRLHYRVRAASLELTLVVANRAPDVVRCEVAWALDADFADLLEAHAEERQQSAEVEALAAEGAVRFRYRHARLPLETLIAGRGEASWVGRPGRLAARLELAPRSSATLAVAVTPLDGEERLTRDDVARREARQEAWRSSITGVAPAEGTEAARVIRHAVTDLGSLMLLEGAEDEWLTPQAGLPLYPALFGRDALTAGWQAAMLDRGAMADAALTRLGRLQARTSDAATDAEPGRIPQQARRGPLARLGVTPYAAYYGDFASPLMYVITLAHRFAWCGERAALDRHWDAARRVLEWARECGDRDGDGYLEYLTRAPEGPKNQGWKDSGDAVVDEAGRPVPAPLGTCELQGYWFAAQQLMAVMTWARGDHDEARALWDAAMALKARFNRDWWLPEERYLALALDADKRPVRSVASNAGHCLASGIVDDAHVPAVVGRLFAPELFSGWGVRTLAATHPAYNPLSYHRGSVWPVENATIVLGLRRYGFDARALDLAGALFDLARRYEGDRLPECVGGYARGEWELPGVYPRANTPQTWNASALVLVLHALLGLQPVAPLDLLIVDPALPPWLPEVTLHDLRLGGATATVRFWREPDGASHAELLHVRGTLHLVRQPPPESLTDGVVDRLKAFVDGVMHK